MVPPTPVRDALAALPRRPRDDVRWTPPGNLHATLRFLGEASPAAVTRALRSAELPSATLRVGPAVVELRRGVVVAPVVGLDDLAAAVVAATATLGRSVPDRPFRGHVTLARTRDGVGGAATGLLGHPVAAAADVTEVVLVDSDTRPGGAVHTVVASVAVG